MERKIHGSMLFLATTSVLLVAVLFSAIFYSFYTSQMKNQVRTEAGYISKTLAYQADDMDYLKALNLSHLDDRVTLISPSGQVLFDNYQDVHEMSNHADRPEIRQALENGYGEDTRFSSTLHQDTLYYAIKLDDGCILRIAKTSSSILRIFLTLLPPVFLIVLLITVSCHFYSKRLTKGIVAPIINISLLEANDGAYAELAPFLQIISQQRAQIQAQIQTLEERANTLQAIISDMREGLILLDAQGNILSANISAAALLCETADELQGKNIVAVTRRKDLLENVRAALCGTASDHTFTFGNKVVQVFFDPVIQNRNPAAAIILFLDVTESANAEKIRREFTANVSHELKTPLTVISGLSEMIELNKTRPEDITPFITKIRSEAKRMISLIEDILKLSELDEGIIQESLEEFDLCELAKTAVASLLPLAEEKEIRLDVAGKSVQVRANRNMLYELFYNLIDNGIKYNNPWGTIAVSIESRLDQAIIEVADTGIGIAPEHIDRIFERFYRVDKSRSRKTGGTGLGLAIVKNIARHHKGYVEIESTPGQGTCIRVFLPCS